MRPRRVPSGSTTKVEAGAVRVNPCCSVSGLAMLDRGEKIRSVGSNVLLSVPVRRLFRRWPLWAAPSTNSSAWLWPTTIRFSTTVVDPGSEVVVAGIGSHQCRSGCGGHAVSGIVGLSNPVWMTLWGSNRHGGEQLGSHPTAAAWLPCSLETDRRA